MNSITSNLDEREINLQLDELEKLVNRANARAALTIRMKNQGDITRASVGRPIFLNKIRFMS